MFAERKHIEILNLYGRIYFEKFTQVCDPDRFFIKVYCILPNTQIIDGFHGYPFKLLEDTPACFVRYHFIHMEISDGVERGRSVWPQAEPGRG